MPRSIYDGTLEESITFAIENDIAPQYGPYSFSRLDGGCNFKFKLKHVDRVPGLKFSRFGVDIGSANHEVADIDVRMRVMRDESDWMSGCDLVDLVIQRNSEYEDYRYEIEQSLERFRENFEINPEIYYDSEQHVAVKLDMTPCDYDDPAAWFRGRIDYLEIDSDYIARVSDYKNYPRIHSESEINNVGTGVGCQSMGYLCMAMAMEPKIQMGFYEVYYFRYGTTRGSSIKNDGGIWVRRYISREEAERWWKFNQRRMMSKERRKSFDPTPSQYACQYCEYVDRCPASLSAQEYIARNQDEARMLAEGLIVNKEQSERAKSALKEYIDKQGSVTLSSGEVVGQTESVSYDIDKVKILEICEKLNLDVHEYVNITKKHVEKLKSAVPSSMRSQLNGAVVKKVTTRRKLN